MLPLFDPLSDLTSLLQIAGNIPQGSNPAYTASDFYTFYPQFNGLIPTAVLNSFIAIANATVAESRWHESWTFGMALYIAHLSTMYLQTSVSGTPTAETVAASGKVQGLESSVSVGEVSVSQDYSTLYGDLKGWGDLKQTAFGQQFIRQARLLGKAGMYVW